MQGKTNRKGRVELPCKSDLQFPFKHAFYFWLESWSGTLKDRWQLAWKDKYPSAISWTSVFLGLNRNTPSSEINLSVNKIQQRVKFFALVFLQFAFYLIEDCQTIFYTVLSDCQHLIQQVCFPGPVSQKSFHPRTYFCVSLISLNYSTVNEFHGIMPDLFWQEESNAMNKSGHSTFCNILLRWNFWIITLSLWKHKESDHILEEKMNDWSRNSVAHAYCALKAKQRQRLRNWLKDARFSSSPQNLVIIDQNWLPAAQNNWFWSACTCKFFGHNMFLLVFKSAIVESLKGREKLSLLQKGWIRNVYASYKKFFTKHGDWDIAKYMARSLFLTSLSATDASEFPS